MENNEFDIRDLFTTESLESVEGVETLIEVEQYLKFLPMRTKQILYLFACGHTQEEIGEMVGLSHQRISQILAILANTPLKPHRE